jgi:hypothetical protein
MKLAKRRWIGLVLIGLSMLTGFAIQLDSVTFIILHNGAFLVIGLVCFFWPDRNSKQTPLISK